MKRDLEEALAFLFTTREAEVRALLSPLVSDRVRWAVLAVSRGDESELLRCVIDAERDWRDVLQAESMSDEPRGSLIRAVPRPEELAFRLHARELTRLGFFDRVVLSGAVAFDPPCDPDPPPITPDGKADRSREPLNYRIGVVLLSAARAWGLWMTHAAG